MRRLQLVAPAKINWTLDVLRARPDGYHEIRSVLQTISLCDIVTLSEADDVELVLTGDAGPLADEPPKRNLAVRAAMTLQARIGTARGVRIEIEKRIPVAAGLGGGSSDAAAVLRGCNVLWDARQDEMNLIEIAGEIGSDPPFFVVGGTASVTGRGEIVRALPDAIAGALVLATPREHHRGEKTASMYRALTPAHYTEGDATLEFEDVVRSRRAVRDEEIANAFEHVVASTMPATARAMGALRDRGIVAHLAGSGPSFFVLLDHTLPQAEAAASSENVGFTGIAASVLPRASAMAIKDV